MNTARILLAVLGLLCLSESSLAYYNPVQGRWLSRDPIGERGGLSLYGFVGNDGVNEIDLFGAEKWSKEQSLNLVKKWAAEEAKDMGWLDDLPKCPDKLCMKNYKPVPCKGRTWRKPHHPPFGTHEGAEWCMRSTRTASGAGQQCCYDKRGYLIREGPAAGSPDRKSPRGMIPIGHYVADVDIYSFAAHAGKEGLELYFSVRPPNQGGGKCDCPCDADYLDQTAPLPTKAPSKPRSPIKPRIRR